MTNHPNRAKPAAAPVKVKKQTVALTRDEWEAIRKSLVKTAALGGGLEQRLAQRIAKLKIMQAAHAKAAE